MHNEQQSEAIAETNKNPLQTATTGIAINFPVPNALAACGLSQEELTQKVRTYVDNNSAKLQAKGIASIEVMTCPDGTTIGGLLYKAAGNAYVPPDYCQDKIREAVQSKEKSVPAPNLPQDCYPPAQFEPFAIPK